MHGAVVYNDLSGSIEQLWIISILTSIYDTMSHLEPEHLCAQFLVYLSNKLLVEKLN